MTSCLQGSKLTFEVGCISSTAHDLGAPKISVAVSTVHVLTHILFAESGWEKKKKTLHT